MSPDLSPDALAKSVRSKLSSLCEKFQISLIDHKQEVVTVTMRLQSGTVSVTAKPLDWVAYMLDMGTITLPLPDGSEAKFTPKEIYELFFRWSLANPGMGQEIRKLAGPDGWEWYHDFVNQIKESKPSKPEEAPLTLRGKTSDNPD